jgi:hypothetical protein
MIGDWQTSIIPGGRGKERSLRNTFRAPGSGGVRRTCAEPTSKAFRHVGLSM